MSPNLDPERENVLLDAVLQDEAWQGTNATLKAGALAAFRRRQRLRRLTRVAAAALVLCASAAVALRWPRPPAATPSPVVTRRDPAPQNPEPVHYLTDEELLALFPRGSCVLAEIDGRKELVFLDPKLERLYLSRAGEAAR